LSVSSAPSIQSPADDLEAFKQNTEKNPPLPLPLPVKRQHPFIRKLRHNFGAVYQRIFSSVVFINIIAMILFFLLMDWRQTKTLSYLATATSANIAVAIISRQDYVVNLLFRSTWLVATSAPLKFRRIMAKMYEFGGIHSGAATSGVLWFTAFTVFLTMHVVSNGMKQPVVMAGAYILLLLLSSISLFAIPQLRTKSHNTFELIHRYAGWSSLLIFWAEIVIFADYLNSIGATGTPTPPLGMTLIQQPTFWFLCVTSLHSMFPWLWLRHLKFEPEFLSDHAIRLHFRGKHIPPFTGLKISHSPLTEWHPFACMFNAEGDGGSVLISDSGDWTRDTIRNPRSHYWVKGLPVVGVLNMSQMFNLVVIVTTGSGIGPCLSFLNGVKKRGSVRLVWSASRPLETFGKRICDRVREVDPNAKIIDSKVSGRPNLVQLAYEIYVEAGAEAVFVISNSKVTKATKYALESRGVPAYGPVWDS
jgi:hypothetical protein